MPCEAGAAMRVGGVLVQEGEHPCTGRRLLRVGRFVGTEQRVRVVWDKHSFPRYRFSVDDNSFFLRDIAQQQYASLFDSWYLKIFRDLHAKYAAKFVLNIYYTTEDGFELPHFPERYKDKWRDSSG